MSRAPAAPVAPAVALVGIVWFPSPRAKASPGEGGRELEAEHFLLRALVGFSPSEQVACMPKPSLRVARVIAENGRDMRPHKQLVFSSFQGSHWRPNRASLAINKC